MSIATTEYEPVTVEALLAEDEVVRPQGPPPRYIPSTRSIDDIVEEARSARQEQEKPAPSERALARLLGMADGYLRDGSLRQALEMYFDLMGSYPGTQAAEASEERLLDVARQMELAGELRTARTIYERLI